MTHNVLAFLSILLLLPGGRIVGAQTDLSWVRMNHAQFDNSAELHPGFMVFWTVNPEGDDNIIRMAVASQSEGWVGLGFSPLGGMTGSAIAMVSQGDDGLEFNHLWALENGAPEFLPDSDMVFIEGSQENGSTEFIFDKAISVPCISHGTDVNLDGQFLMWAYGDDNNFGKHDDDKRGVKLVTLNDFNALESGVGHDFGDDEKWSVLTPEMEIPADDTSYCVSLHRVPEGVGSIAHITGDTPVIGGDLVHHLIVYGCYGELPYDEKELERLQREPSCDRRDARCYAFIAEWAPGNFGRAYPPDMGFPFGSDRELEWMMLEVHYNNPEGTTGVRDTSGIDMYWSLTLRPIEAGAFQVGDLSPNNHLWQVPAGEISHVKEFDCPEECTQEGFLEPINIIAAGYHMHETGSAMQVSIIRDGVEVYKFPMIYHYDFFYQPFIPYDFQVLPGDRLVTTCWFNTADYDEPVRSGLASYEEMCIFFIVYYPAQPLISCDANKYRENRDDENSPFQDQTICMQIGKEQPLMPGNEAPGFDSFERMALRENICHSGIDTSGTENLPGLAPLGDIQDPRADTPFAETAKAAALVISVTGVFGLLITYILL